jgi:hypothetical protein
VSADIGQVTALTAAYVAARFEIDCELQDGGYLTAYGCDFVLGMASASAAAELEAAFDPPAAADLGMALARAALATW